MYTTEMSIEKLFQFNPTKHIGNVHNRNFGRPHAHVASIAHSAPPIPVPSIESVAPADIPNYDSEIPWGRIILSTAIIAGVVYIGYRVYKKHQEEQKKHVV